MEKIDWTASVMDFFAEICKLPRPSGHEEKVGEYLKDFAAKRGLGFKQDKIGNVVISKPASAGMENRRTVILQAHQDMVCEKDASVSHDFFNQPIETYIEDGWLKAKGTTLGADDGMGIAMALAILDSDEIKHGPLECLFTVSEETGLCGAQELQPDMMNGTMLINLDSEDEGEIFIGCAGGVRTNIEFDYAKEEIPEGFFFVNISVDKLHGGHSGDDIDKGFGNANKILNRFLYESMDKYDLRLCSFDGGNLHNAIPRDAAAVIAVPSKDKEALRVDFNIFADKIQNELRSTEKSVEFRMESADSRQYCIDSQTARNFITAVQGAVNGVFAMCMDIPGMVETSSNLASVRTLDSIIRITTSQRSSVESCKWDVAHTIGAIFSLAGARIEFGEGYPGWAPNTDSALLQIATSTYRRLFNKEPKVRTIHAGLECGLFLESYPNLDMISVGPTLRGVHSPSERLELCTVDMVFLHLIAMLQEIPE